MGLFRSGSEDSAVRSINPMNEPRAFAPSPRQPAIALPLHPSTQAPADLAPPKGAPLEFSFAAVPLHFTLAPKFPSERKGYAGQPKTAPPAGADSVFIN